MTDPRFQAWLDKVKAAPSEEKSRELFFALENLGYAQVEALLDAGADTAKVANGIPFLAFALRRTDDFRMTELLLDKGVSAKGVAFKDLWALFEEDGDRAYRLLQRFVDAGMETEERAKAAIYAVKDGQAALVERVLLKPGEDVVTFIDLGKPHDKDNVLSALKPDTAAAEALYNRHFAQGVTPDRLAATVGENGMTGFMLAVRGNHFDAVAQHFTATGASPDPGEVLREDRHGQSVISLMGHRKTLAQLFAPALWHSRPEAALMVLDRVPARYAEQLDRVAIVRDIAQLRLSKLSKGRPAPPAKKGA